MKEKWGKENKKRKDEVGKEKLGKFGVWIDCGNEKDG